MSIVVLAVKGSWSILIDCLLFELEIAEINSSSPSKKEFNLESSNVSSLMLQATKPVIKIMVKKILVINFICFIILNFYSYKPFCYIYIP